MKKSKFEILDMLLGRTVRGISNLVIKSPTKTVHQAVGNLSIEDSARFAFDNFTEAVIFDSRIDLWDFCIASTRSHEPVGRGLILEFGVWKGESINYFAEKLSSYEIFGFDSFKGLEENWSGTRLTKGIFNLESYLPKVKQNVKLIEGWFQDTVPEFQKYLQDRKISILHIDSDTYSPASCVLTSFAKNIVAGTIVIFDEFFGYPNWRSHEFKAWEEFIIEHKIEFEYIGYTNMQVAILIK